MGKNKGGDIHCQTQKRIRECAGSRDVWGDLRRGGCGPSIWAHYASLPFLNEWIRVRAVDERVVKTMRERGLGLREGNERVKPMRE